LSVACKPVSRPNIILITTDQQRADHLGCYGNTVLRTPNIDALANRGTVFDRCFVASPVCMPNRAAMMTSRMPSAAGVRMNGVPLPTDSLTFVEMLRRAGWRTALIGKGHLQNMTDRPAAWTAGLAPGAEPLQAQASLRDGPAYSQESIAQWTQQPSHQVSLPYYGFEHVQFCLEHGDITGGDYPRWLQQRGIDPAQWVGRANALPNQAPPMLDAWRTRIPPELYPSTFVTEKTVSWIQDHLARAAEETPFFVHCSFPDPHHPFTPPGKYWDLYDPRSVVLPETFGSDRTGDHPLKRALHEEMRQDRRPVGSSRAMAVSEEEARWAIALNYGSLALIDDAIGRLTDYLARQGLTDNTLIIYTSDHGDFMGDHGLLNKGPLHYRSLIRVPFIWADPKTPHALHDDRLCSSIDLGTSILARARVQKAHGMKGLDLMQHRASTKEAAPSRDAVLIEEEAHHRYPQSPFPLKLRTLVTDRWRLSVRADEAWGELYDLMSDPHETNNLWWDEGLSRVRAALSMRLIQEMQRQADDVPLPSRMA
jgi:arylsulfatase A-like enzyme